MRKAIGVLTLIASLLASTVVNIEPIHAQGGGALVVTSCGSAVFAVGSTRTFTVNTNGILC